MKCFQRAIALGIFVVNQEFLEQCQQLKSYEDIDRVV